MQIVIARPPNYEAIAAAFPFVLKRSTVIFCWGDQIYNPGRATIDSSLMAHETIHSAQQCACGGPEKWWTAYIASARFRLDQELPAHCEEYEVATAGMGRNQRRQHLRAIAQRLAGPLYGKLLTVHEAKRLISRRDAD